MPTPESPVAPAEPDAADQPLAGGYAPLRRGERLSSDPDPDPDTSPSPAPPPGLGEPAVHPDPPVY